MLWWPECFEFFMLKHNQYLNRIYRIQVADPVVKIGASLLLTRYLQVKSFSNLSHPPTNPLLIHTHVKLLICEFTHWIFLWIALESEIKCCIIWPLDLIIYILVKSFNFVEFFAKMEIIYNYINLNKYLSDHIAVSGQEFFIWIFMHDFH